MIGCCGPIEVGNFRQVRAAFSFGFIYFALDGSTNPCTGRPGWRMRTAQRCINGLCSKGVTTYVKCSPFAPPPIEVLTPPSDLNEFSRLIADEGGVISETHILTADHRRDTVLHASKSGGPDIEDISDILLEAPYEPQFEALVAQAFALVNSASIAAIPDGRCLIYELTEDCDFTSRLIAATQPVARNSFGASGAGFAGIEIRRSVVTFGSIYFGPPPACLVATTTLRDVSGSTCPVVSTSQRCTPVTGPSGLVLSIPIPAEFTDVTLSGGVCPGGCNQAP